MWCEWAGKEQEERMGLQLQEQEGRQQEEQQQQAEGREEGRKRKEGGSGNCSIPKRIEGRCSSRTCNCEPKTPVWVRARAAVEEEADKAGK